MEQMEQLAWASGATPHLQLAATNFLFVLPRLHLLGIQRP